MSLGNGGRKGRAVLYPLCLGAPEGLFINFFLFDLPGAAFELLGSAAAYDFSGPCWIAKDYWTKF